MEQREYSKTGTTTLEDVFNTYHKKIFNLAYRMTGDKDDANDITQETFIQAFNSIDKFKEESGIYTWLYKIAKNKCLRFLEKRKRSSFIRLQELIDNVSSHATEDISEDEKSFYITQVKDGCLSGLLRCLSLPQRLSFILHILLELPIGQVAVIIGKSENAARILVHRSRQNIKEFLCSNCSLFNPKNNCRCENLINFSLNKGWIGKESIVSSNTTKIEDEINDLKRIVSLYKSLKEIIPPDILNSDFKKMLSEKKNFSILSNKKVK